MKFVQKRIKFRKSPLSNLHGTKLLQYIWDYYKLPIGIFCILLYIIGYMICGHLFKKEPVLYAALVNASFGDTLTDSLTDGFLEYMDADSRRTDFILYKNLYLTENAPDSDRQYIYASQMKILGCIDGERLDVVLMNKEAFDAFSEKGYLSNLKELLQETDEKSKMKAEMKTEMKAVSLYSTFSPFLTSRDQPFGIDLSKTKLMQSAGVKEPLYLGIIANSPRKQNALFYLQYLFSTT